MIIPNEIVWRGRYLKKINFNNDFRKYLIESYDVGSSYFNYESFDKYSGSVDENGFPWDSERGYNPTALCQYALSYYDKNNLDALDIFLEIVNFICTQLQEDGGYAYCFDFNLHGIQFENPWYSCMAQSQILSVLCRAYILTMDSNYLEKAENVYNFMVGLYEQKKGLKQNINQFCEKVEIFRDYKNKGWIFEEYVNEHSSYVLNGNLFALVGLYEYYELTRRIDVLENFSQGLESIKLMLPFYDFNGSSCYDLTWLLYDQKIDFTSKYAHDCHIYLLDYLAKKTNDITIIYYRDKFIEYIENINFYLYEE